MAGLLMPTRAMAASPGRAWTEVTARSAVRLAAGQGTAGLVAPAVSGLAECALTAMFVESLKGGLLLALALAAVGLSVSVPRAGGDRPVAASGLAPAVAEPGWPGQRVVRPAQPQEVRGPGLERPLVASRPGHHVVRATRTSVIADKADPTPETPEAPTPTPPAVLAIGFEPPASPRPAPGPAVRGPEDVQIRGRELFERSWVKDDPRGHGGDGLGPVFNGRSCVDCHNQGGPGGAGGADRNIEIATVTEDPAWGGYSYAFSMDFATGRFETRMGFPQASSRESRPDPRLLASIHPGFGGSRSVVLHHYGTDPAYHTWRESVPGQHGTLSVRSSRRNTPPLFGLGLVDAIPDDAIEAASRRKFAGSAQLKGRVSRLKDGRVGRFGWKAQTATLAEFVRSAAAGEMGLEIPGQHQASDPRLPGMGAPGLDMDEADCSALVDHVRSLPTPVVIAPENDADAAQVKAGETIFKSIGCTGCHMPQLGDVEGIYSDLLLHDMGTRPGDSEGYTVFSGESPAPAERPGASSPATATAREWRTPPLWGLRDSGPYLHDSRAARVDQAITLHGGQGVASARRYAELSPRRKRQLEAFLMSLAAPPAGE